MAAIAVLISSHPGFAQKQTQLLFDRANDSLEAHHFTDALALYHQLEQQGTISGGLFLNMGISYIRLDSLGKAKYYFMKASRFDGVHEQAEKGLAYVEQQFPRQSAKLPKLPWENAVEWLRYQVGTSYIFGFSLILLNIGVILFAGHWFLAAWEKLLRLSGIICSGIALLLLLIGFYVQYVDHRYKEAVMVQQQSNVLEKPLEDASIVSQAYEGYTFTVDQYKSRKEDGWSYIRMSNGLYGWIPNNEIMIL